MTRLLQHWPRRLGALAGAAAGVMVNLAASTNDHLDLFGRVYVIAFGTLLYAGLGWIVGKGVEK